MSRYNPNDDYCEAASNFQSVKSEDDVRKLNPSLSEEDVNKERTDNLYPCSDKYKMGTIQDDQIYIATTDAQHDQIYNHQHVDANGGLSGFFSDQATIDSCKDNQNAVSNKAYNEACQMAAYQPTGKGDATYKPHIDCFEIDREALYRNYGTYDFNAAIAKCEANNQFGSGGGNQGYNPYISEMIDNGTLKYNPDKSYSDYSISNSKHCNPNQLYC